MALLPLAGWAADFATEAKVTVDDIYFGLNVAKVGDVKYVTVKINTNTLNEDADGGFTLEKSAGKVVYYTTDQCNTKAALATGSLTPVPGTYYIKILPYDAANSNWAAGKIIVKPMPLKVAVSNSSKTFNNKGTEDTDEVLGAVTSITPSKKTGWDDAITSGALFDALKAQMTVGRETGKNYKDGGYKYTIVLNNSNYTVAAADVTGTFTINKRTLPSTIGTGNTNITVTVSDNEKIYNGNNQKATVTIKDNGIDYTLASGDYTVKYDGNANVKNAKPAGYVISFTSKGNYDGTTEVTLNGATDKKLIIAKKALDIYVDDLTKVYDGTADIPADVTFSYSGLVGGDITKENPFGADMFKAVYASATPANKQFVGSYGLKAKEKEASDFANSSDYTAYQTTLNGTTYPNYAVTFTEIGLLTVDPRPVTITVSPDEKFFGAADPNFNDPAGYAVPAATGNKDAINTNVVEGQSDKTWFERAYIVVRTNATIEAVGEYPEVLALQAKADDVMKTAYTLSDEQLANVKQALAQYTITENKGKFTIKTAALTVTPKKVTKTYGENYSLTEDFEVIATNSAGQRVTLNAPLPTVKFKNAADNTKNPTDAGVYIMVVDGTISATGYDGEHATRNEGQFIIKKKELTAVLDDQVLMVGDTKAAFLNSKVAFEDADGNDGVKAGDAIYFELDFNAGDGSDADLLHDGEAYDVRTQEEADTWNRTAGNVDGALTWTAITAGTTKFDAAGAMTAAAYNDAIHPSPAVDNTTTITAEMIGKAYEYNEALEGARHRSLMNHGAWDEGVKITVPATKVGYANKNYEIDDDVFAVLTVVVNNALVLNCNDDDYANIVKLNGQNVPVQINFNNRTRKVVNESATVTAENPWHTWKAGEWNALVLPFDITVAELSNRLGHDAYNYTIVNTIVEDAPAGKFQFQLFTGTIPANTPFMVKTVGNITTVDENGDPVDAANINFGTKTIKAPTSKTPAAEFDNGFKLVGQYENFKLDKTTTGYDGTNALRKFMLGDYDDEGFSYFGSSSKNSWTIIPLDCYVDLSGDPVAARNVVFEFEEADGSITAIKSVSADAEKAGINKEGWYTINGVKLQNAPTQKGIYIFNGKKLVVK